MGRSVVVRSWTSYSQPLHMHDAMTPPCLHPLRVQWALVVLYGLFYIFDLAFVYNIFCHSITPACPAMADGDVDVWGAARRAAAGYI